MKAVFTGKSSRGWSWLALLVAGVALLVSPRFAYWKFELRAPQYPGGLFLWGYPQRIEGDVREIDLLNHYIGMRELNNAAELERRVALPSIVAIAACLIVVAIWRSRWALLLLLPAIVFPFAFLADLQFWLCDYGLNLDPHAPLSTSVKPFVPLALGTGRIANFVTHGSLGGGFYLAATASAACLLVAWIRLRSRPAEKPACQRAAKPATTVCSTAVLLLLSSTGMAEGATLIVRANGESPSIAEAIKRAVAGDTILVDGGIHAGPLVINKTLHLVGRGEAVIAGPGSGTVVTLSAPGCRLSGLTIRGSGNLLASENAGLLVRAANAVVENNRFEDVLFGICLQRAPGSVVRGNRARGKPLSIARRGDLIRIWYSDGVTIENNDIQGGRDVVLWFSKDLVVRGNTIRHGRYGLHFMYCHDAAVQSNVLRDNSVGAFLMYSRDLRLNHNWVESNRGASGYGIGLKDMETVQIADNVMTDNRAGIFLENSSGIFERNLLAHNDIGLLIQPSARGNTFRDNSFVENGEQVSAEGQSGTNTANTWNANYWSDYRGYDANDDAIGDRPYLPTHLFEQLTNRNSALRLFAGNPSTAAIDFASQTFPIFQPRPKLVDEAPRMSPLASPVASPPRHGNRLLWFGSAMGMLCWPAGLLLIGSWLAPSRLRGRAATAPAAAKPAPAPSQPAIAVSGLTKRFGRLTAVDNLSFQVGPGEVVVLWGLNGAGKTTVLRCLLGLLPYRGSAHVHGLVCRGSNKAARRLLGYVPQEVRLHADQTVLQTVTFYARLRRVDCQTALNRLADWDLQDAAQRAVGHLSGGMKQKLALVLALLSDPPVLLLDEPTSNLDAQSRHEFGKLLERLKHSGKTLLFCSHRAAEVWRLADRVVVLESGRKVAEGTPDQLQRYLKRSALLSLTLPPEWCAEAAGILGAAGFSVERDGSQVLVSVPAGRKVEPIRLLADHHVPIVDFELDDERSGDATGQG